MTILNRKHILFDIFAFKLFTMKIFFVFVVRLLVFISIYYYIYVLI